MLRKEEKNMGNIEIKTREEKKQREKAYYEEAPQIGGRRPSRIRQQINRGMTVFVIVAACILFYFALLRLGHISDVIFKIIDVLKPVLYGCVIAYLLNPIVKRVDAFLIPKLQERMKKPENAEKVSRSVGIFVSLIILIVLITVLLNMLIPELYSSIRNMVLTLPKQVNDALDKINSIQLEDSTTVAILKNALEEGTTMLTNWLRTDLMTQVNSLMSNLTVGIFNVISEDIPLSKAIKMAQEAGYSEPDPRVDLNGQDVIRKLVILAREAGYRVEQKDVEKHLFIPDEYFQGSLADFWKNIPKLDAEFEEKRKQLVKEGKRFRFVAKLENGKTEVSLQPVDNRHPFYQLEGSNNVILLTTERYKEYPMVIKGYGAGAMVTAAGVFADIISIANIR